MFRQQATIDGFNLNSTTSRVRVSVAPGSSIAVYARSEFGTWATATLRIKHASSSDSPSAEFTTAKTISAGGGVSSIDADEMLAVREIDITCEVVEGSAATATLRVVGDILGISSITGGIMTVAGGTKVPTPAPSGGPAGGGVSPAP